MEKINETHVTFGYLKDPRLPEDISVSPASLEKKASSVGGIAVFVGAMAANLFGESEGAVISPALIAEKLNDKSHGIEAKTGVFEPSVKIQPFEWESFLASSGPDPEGNSSETPPVFPPSGDVWMTEDGKHSAPVYVPSLDALSTCGVDPEAKNICPTDKELIERGLMPEGQDKNENLAPFVHPDTRMAGNTEKSAGKASPLKQPENQDPEPTFDPEATPATAPEVGAVISNIAQHVGDGLAEGKKYEIRAMDEGVMFRDKAAWKSGETTKQTDWWEVIRVEGDFLLGKDNQGNEFWVSANGDSEATHLDIRPAKLTDEDLGKEEVPVKDVAEPEVSGEQAKISIDIEKLNQIIKEPMKVIGTQSLYEDSGRQHTVSSTDGRTEIQIASLKKARIMFDGEIRVLVEALVDGKIYIKKSDGKGMIGWMSLPGLDESEMAGLSVDELKDLGFGVENQSIDGRPIDSLSDKEKQLVIFRRDSGEQIANKQVPGQYDFSLWETNTAPKYKEGEHLYQTYALAGVIREFEVLPDTSDAVLTVYSDQYTHGPKEGGIKKTVRVYIDLADFYLKLLSVKREDRNWWFDITSAGNWSLKDLEQHYAFFDIETGQQHQKIIDFLSNQTSDMLEVRMKKGTIEVYGD